MPKKRFGQNFLTDVNLVRRIVEESGTSKGDRVLEIGSGEGILTQALIDAGAHVVAFEIDRDLFGDLKNRFEGKEVEFIFRDFLKSDLPISIDRCVSNIPYNVSTPIIKKLIDLEIPSMTLTVQKEYANRILARPKTKAYGSLTVFVGIHANSEKLFDIDRGSFFPVPNVDSTVIKLTKTDKWLNLIEDVKFFDTVVKTAFSQKRKILKNNLKTIKGISDTIGKLGFSPKVRAEELSINDFITLSNSII